MLINIDDANKAEIIKDLIAAGKNVNASNVKEWLDACEMIYVKRTDGKSVVAEIIDQPEKTSNASKMTVKNVCMRLRHTLGSKGIKTFH